RLAEPPDGVHGIFRPDFPLVDPLNRAGQLRGIEPVKILGQEEADVVAEMEQHPEIVKASRRDALLVRAPEIQHERAVVRQFLTHDPGEFGKPTNVLVLVLVAVFLLPLKREWRTRDDEIDACVRDLSEEFTRVPAVSGPKGSRIDRGLSGK